MNYTSFNPEKDRYVAYLCLRRVNEIKKVGLEYMPHNSDAYKPTVYAGPPTVKFYKSENITMNKGKNMYTTHLHCIIKAQDNFSMVILVKLALRMRFPTFVMFAQSTHTDIMSIE